VLLYLVGSVGHVMHFPSVRGTKHQRTILHARVGPMLFLKKARQDTLRQTCVFASGRICVSLSAFWGIGGVKHCRTIFHSQVGLVRIPQKACRDTLRQTCGFASGGIYGSRSTLRCIRAMKL
jgi:hypothetical protein